MFIARLTNTAIGGRSPMSNVKISPVVAIMAAMIDIVQVVDVVIHAATDQLEPLRVIANGIILVWTALVMIRIVNADRWQAVVVALGGYLGLNILFLAREGVVNPTNGEPRLILFALVTLTILLALELVRRSLQEAQAPPH